MPLAGAVPKWNVICHSVMMPSWLVAWQGRGWPQPRAELAALHPSLQPWECSAGASPSSPPLASSTDLSCPVLLSQTWAPAPQVGSALQRNPLPQNAPQKPEVRCGVRRMVTAAALHSDLPARHHVRDLLLAAVVGGPVLYSGSLQTPPWCQP